MSGRWLYIIYIYIYIYIYILQTKNKRKWIYKTKSEFFLQWKLSPMSIGKAYAYHNKNQKLKFKTYIFSWNLYLQYTLAVIIFGYGDIIENI